MTALVDALIVSLIVSLAAAAAVAILILVWPSPPAWHEWDTSWLEDAELTPDELAAFDEIAGRYGEEATDERG